jgi:hypothetical protein
LNPITETRYSLVRYVVLWGFFAAAYAAAFGLAAALPAGAAVLDGVVFGVVSGFEGLLLWNVLKYGAVGGSAVSGAGAWNSIRIGRFFQVTVAGILFVSVAVGAECLALYAATGTLPAKFAMTIPAKCLTTAAVYACFALWYSSAARSDNGGEARPTVESDSPVPAQTPAADHLERITVRGQGGNIEVIGVDEIVYIQAEGDYVAIVTAAGRRLKEGTMKYFEEMLPAGRFVRVHRSYIVAVSHISRIETSGRDHLLVLRDGGPNYQSGGSIRISDAGYKLLKRTLGL